ncbi:MAG TPA: NAD-dependent epimerase/dehydratase family protein [Solirubrobacterales bacterium]|nr:NAD-dependent epimerase/dehydratase family protein [Solirubrobacterales bacterium]
MRVFVTGATGFIGGCVARQLRERGDEVVCLVRTPQKAGGLKELGCELVSGDLGDRETIAEAMAGCDGAIHAAAMYEVGIPESQRPAMYEANVLGTENVLGAAGDAGLPKIVYVSTCGAFGNTHHEIVDESYEHPGESFTSYYEQTKVEAHRAAKKMMAAGLPCTIVQPGGVYGPGDTSQLFDLLDQFLKGKMPLIPFPDLGICLAHVEDTAAGIVLALDRGVAGETYVLAGPPSTMREAVGLIAKVSGKKAPRRALPTGLMKALTPIGPLVGKLMGQPPNLRELISSADDVTFWATNEKAVSELGFSPRGIEEGFRQTLDEDERLPAPA